MRASKSVRSGRSTNMTYAPREVDIAMTRSLAAGGTLIRPARTVFWGGYTGYFADPDGHLWEVAHNPGFPLSEDGRLLLPD